MRLIFKYVQYATSIGLICFFTQFSIGQEVFEFNHNSPASSSDRVKKLTNTPPQGRTSVYPLLLKYKGEEHKGVKYFSKKVRATHRVVVKNGALTYAKGGLVNPNVEHPSADIQFPKRMPNTDQARQVGFAIYIMDLRGHMYVSFEAERDVIHHSSLASGDPVLAAGEMLIFKGRVYAINNQSGHYRPPPASLNRVIETLRNQGMNTQSILVKRFGVDL